MSKLKLRAVFVPRFGSQSLNTPVREYVIELPPSTSNDKKNVALREKEVQSAGSKVRKGLLNSKKRVNTAEHNNNNRQTTSKKRKNEDKSHKTQSSPVLAVTTRPRERMSACGGGVGSQPTSQSSCSQGSTSLVDDVYTFSQGSSDTPSSAEKEKAKLGVLQTIDKMLRENSCIRARLTALKQARCNLT